MDVGPYVCLIVCEIVCLPVMLLRARVTECVLWLVVGVWLHDIAFFLRVYLCACVYVCVLCVGVCVCFCVLS